MNIAQEGLKKKSHLKNILKIVCLEIKILSSNKRFSWILRLRLRFIVSPETERVNERI